MCLRPTASFMLLSRQVTDLRPQTPDWTGLWCPMTMFAEKMKTRYQGLDTETRRWDAMVNAEE